MGGGVQELVSTTAEMVLGRYAGQVFRNAAPGNVGHAHHQVGGGELFDHCQVAAMHLHQRRPGLVLQVVDVLVGRVAGYLKKELARQGIAVGVQAGGRKADEHIAELESCCR